MVALVGMQPALMISRYKTRLYCASDHATDIATPVVSDEVQAATLKVRRATSDR
jgi:hypothetical protein